ncbi:MAG: cyclase family protein [Alphaproteobacteria bacterium]|nr:cyclase family protein [Alphaproteobacteria bacterium]
MDSRYLQDKDDLKSSQPIDEDRRNFLTAGLVGGAVAAGALAAGVAHAQQVAQAPALSAAPWWPHPRWGKDDQGGASNWITPAKVLDAVKLIKDGKIYRIGRVYESAMPKFGERAFTLRIPGTPTGGPFGANKLIYHDEFLATEIGQTGTQFDGLAHIGIQMGKDGDMNDMRYYNGVTELEMAGAYGMKKLGIENCKPFFTRGHLFDVEAVRPNLEAGQEIMVADLRAALQRQNMQEADIKEGDAVFFNTGWGKLWMKNNDKYNNGEPGIGLEVAKWCIDKGVCLTGGDSWAVEVVPNPNKDLAFPVHGELITKHGIYNHENMDFSGLIADRKYQFAYIFSPAPIKGATGSNGGPIAVT